MNQLLQWIIWKKKTNNKSNGKKYKTQYNEEDENYYDNKENYINPEDSQNVENDLEISSINDEEKMQGVKYIKILDNRNNKPMKKITKNIKGYHFLILMSF